MKSSYILAGFALLYLIFAAIFSSDVSDKMYKTFPGNGGVYGPLVVEEKNASYEISLSNSVPLNKWSYIEVDVLDGNKEHLFSFGDEMWHESGYDSDGHWEESKSDFNLAVTFPEPGEYYFDISAERNDGAGNHIRITAVKERGSSLAFTVLAVVSVILAVIAHYTHGFLGKSQRRVEVRHIVLVVLLILVFFGALLYSMRGWGYMGYNGYHHGPSFFYMGGPSIYHEPSNREGSVSGSGHRGGGFSGGK